MEDIVKLREHLFATLDALRDPDKPMEIERAKAIAGIAQVVINTAKVEVDHLKLTSGRGTGFIPDAQPALPNGVTGSTTHRLRG